MKKKELNQQDKLIRCIHNHMWIMTLPILVLLFTKYWLGIFIMFICILLVYYSQKKANMFYHKNMGNM